MIVVKLELWPLGDERRKIDLGRAEIYNEGPPRDLSSYGVKLLKGAHYSPRPGSLYKEGRVSAFPRKDKRFGPWELLALALEATVGDRIRRLKRVLSDQSPDRPARALDEKASERNIGPRVTTRGPVGAATAPGEIGSGGHGGNFSIKK